MWRDHYAGQEWFITARAEVEHAIAKENLKKEDEHNLKLQPPGEYELFGVDSAKPNRHYSLHTFIKPHKVS